MHPIHRDDGELCGYVEPADGSWRAVTVFGAVLEVTGSPADAETVVRQLGLASLAERWLLQAPDLADDEIVCLQEASPEGVTVAIGYYSMPGVPTRRIERHEITSGQVVLRRLG